MPLLYDNTETYDTAAFTYDGAAVFGRIVATRTLILRDVLRAAAIDLADVKRSAQLIISNAEGRFVEVRDVKASRLVTVPNVERTRTIDV